MQLMHAHVMPHSSHWGGLPHLPPLVIISAVDEHSADLAHSHDSLWRCQLRMQCVMLLLVGLRLLRAHHAAVHIPAFCQGLRPGHGIRLLSLQDKRQDLGPSRALATQRNFSFLQLTLYKSAESTALITASSR